MQRGFSLVELSIVLVILGLLTGGILAGQSLIRAAELRAASTEYQRFAAALNTFRDKYFAVPGDFRDATKFWGLQVSGSGCVSNSGLSTPTSPGTCDGNGNGATDPAGGVSQTGELYQFWRQLALAGLIEGNYDGLAGAAGVTNMIPGTNVPRSRVNNGGWGLGYLANFIGDGNAYAFDYGNHWIFGGTAANAPPEAPFLKPEEAWNLDTKMDDGKPARGKIIARFWNDACATADDGGSANNDYAASYNLRDSSLRCSLIFPKVF